ncbi:MAG TPA: alpha/beta hydrolase [Devosia sp.]|uniref:alpha/beta hydrolase n=1 Tax=Devosia sp. TaxID=1871048 RepID=UPI002DDCA978|nr:alpha/beta hydrolase [Devosia sp.]HEV2518886.1 alpha/beta hydrolase [Devosia sp.]
MDDLDDRRPDRTRLLPELRDMLEAAERAGTPSNDQLGVARARIASEVSLASYWDLKDELPPPLTFTLGDPAIRCRLYRGGCEPGTILFLHGGGWVVGSLDTHDGAARALAKAASCALLSVEYRKAPEHPFPAGLDDAETALRWIIAEGAGLGLSDHIILSGDSAGANIAAALALRARDHGIGLAGQMLIYPATDLARETTSTAQFAHGYFLSRATLRWYITNYLSGADPTNPEASPLLAPDLTGLCPTLLVTADHDPLRDEGRAYAARLTAAGNAATLQEWPGTTHGFMIMAGVTPAARELIGVMGSWAREVWG